MGKAKRCHGNWEPSADSMFFHSFPTHHQLPSISLPVHSSFHCLGPASPHSFLFALSITTTPLSPFSLSLCLSHPSSPSSISRSLHQPHPCFSSPPHPFIPHWLHFYPLALFFPPFFFSIFLSPPLFLFSQLLRLNPQLCAKSSKEETERLKSNIKKKRQKKKIKPPPDAREL